MYIIRYKKLVYLSRKLFWYSHLIIFDMQWELVFSPQLLHRIKLIWIDKFGVKLENKHISTHPPVISYTIIVNIEQTYSCKNYIKKAILKKTTHRGIFIFTCLIFGGENAISSGFMNRKFESNNIEKKISQGTFILICPKTCIKRCRVLLF